MAKARNRYNESANVYYEYYCLALEIRDVGGIPSACVLEGDFMTGLSKFNSRITEIKEDIKEIVGFIKHMQPHLENSGDMLSVLYAVADRLRYNIPYTTGTIGRLAKRVGKNRYKEIDGLINYFI
jgi:hypothetical protein